VKEIYSNLLVERSLSEQYTALFDGLRWTEQLAMLEAIFRDVEKKHFQADAFSGHKINSSQPISDVAALCSVLISKRPNLESQLIDWLSKGQGGSIQKVELRRAIIINFLYRKGSLCLGFNIDEPLLTSALIDLIATLLTKSLEQSADKIYTQHAPMRSQEGICLRSLSM
jgi:telomere length regulation protein